MFIDWSREKEPNEECRYNHVEADTALGLARISWKGWKVHPSYDIEFLKLEFDLFTKCEGFCTLDDAKDRVEEIFKELSLLITLMEVRS